MLLSSIFKLSLRASIFLFLTTTDLEGASLYVNANGSVPSPPYADWATAATNIQDAVDVAETGDHIIVTNGVYKVGGRAARSGATTNRVVFDKAIVVRSVNGPGVTVIEGASDPIDPNGFGANSIRCAYVGTNATMDGFTLTKGTTTHGEHGGGVWAEDSAVITNCVILGNLAAWQGGGAYGGAIYRCRILGNSAAWGGGVAASRLFNSLLAGNEVGEVGGGAYRCSLFNCTVVANTTFETGGGVWECSVQNSIVYLNEGSAPNHVGGSFTNSCTSPLPTRGIDNIDNEPQFVDFVGRNYRLRSESPCVNSGSNSDAFGSTDLDGRPRIVGTAVDMGAYELQDNVDGAFLGWLQRHTLPVDGTTDMTDSDGDGANNWQEWRAGTVPTNILSVLRLLTTSRSGTDLVITWTSITNRTYSLERDTNPSGRFQPLISGLVGKPDETAYTDTNTMNADVLFYRIKVE